MQPAGALHLRGGVLPSQYSCSVPCRGTRRPPLALGRQVGSLLQFSLRDTIPRGGRKVRFEAPPLVIEWTARGSPIAFQRSSHRRKIPS